MEPWIEDVIIPSLNDAAEEYVLGIWTAQDSFQRAQNALLTFDVIGPNQLHLLEQAVVTASNRIVILSEALEGILNSTCFQRDILQTMIEIRDVMPLPTSSSLRQQQQQPNSEQGVDFVLSEGMGSLLVLLREQNINFNDIVVTQVIAHLEMGNTAYQNGIQQMIQKLENLYTFIDQAAQQGLISDNFAIKFKFAIQTRSDVLVRSQPIQKCINRCYEVSTL